MWVNLQNSGEIKKIKRIVIIPATARILDSHRIWWFGMKVTPMLYLLKNLRGKTVEYFALGDSYQQKNNGFFRLLG